MIAVPFTRGSIEVELNDPLQKIIGSRNARGVQVCSGATRQRGVASATICFSYFGRNILKSDRRGSAHLRPRCNCVGAIEKRKLAIAKAQAYLRGCNEDGECHDK